MKRINFTIIIILISFNIFAQNAKKLNRQGIRFYSDTSFSEAEKAFRSALQVDSLSYTYNFNLGDALYQKAEYSAAEEKYKSLTELTFDKSKLADAYHNTGNAQLKQVEELLGQQDLENAISKTEASIESYKNSMRNNPEDKETKYNYLVAKELLKSLQEQQQQQQNQQQNQENQEQQQDNQEQNQDENQQDGENQDTDQDGIPDKEEKGQDPSNPTDTDKDGAPDYNDVDADNDGLPDSYEAGQDPTNPQDTDNDGTPDYQDLDSNNDGTPDSEEAMQMYEISKEDALRILEAIDKADQEVKEKVIDENKTRKKDNEKDW